MQGIEVLVVAGKKLVSRMVLKFGNESSTAQCTFSGGTGLAGCKRLGHSDAFDFLALDDGATNPRVMVNHLIAPGLVYSIYVSNIMTPRNPLSMSMSSSPMVFRVLQVLNDTRPV